MVESANNEMRIETQLADLDNTWREIDFQYNRMEDFTELQILYVPEENQVAAQNYDESFLFLTNSSRSVKIGADGNCTCDSFSWRSLFPTFHTHPRIPKRFLALEGAIPHPMPGTGNSMSEPLIESIERVSGTSRQWIKEIPSRSVTKSPICSYSIGMLLLPSCCMMKIQNHKQRSSSIAVSKPKSICRQDP
jgi:hypothetical protein